MSFNGNGMIPGKKTMVDIGKGMAANLSAFLIAAAATLTAWGTLGLPMPASADRVSQLEQRVNDTQAFFLGDKLLGYQRELRQIEAAIRTYERDGEEPPEVYIDNRENLRRLIYDTERRLRKLGVEP